MSPLGAASSSVFGAHTASPPPPDPTGDFASGGDRFGLLGNPSFFTTVNSNATTSSVLKNGSTFTGEMVTWYNALLFWVRNESVVSSVTARDDTYIYARTVRSGMQALMQPFRLTGDLRLLDKVLDYLDSMRGKLAVGWDNQNTTGRDFYDKTLYDANDWSPYRCWVWRGSGGFEPVYSGADLHYMDEPSTAAWIMQVAYACQLNSGFASPSGISNRYSNAATFWKAWLLEWQAKWQGGGTSSWRKNYRGLQYPSRHRATDDEWPFCGKYGDTHTTITNIPAMHYWHLLFNEERARQARDRLATKWRTQELMDVSSHYGTAVVWTAGFRSEGSPSNTLQASPYIGYVIQDCADMFYCGFDPQWGVTNIREIMRSVAAFMLQPDGSMKGDIYGEQPLSGFRNDDRGRTASQTVYVSNAYGLGIPFEDLSDEYVSEKLLANHTSYAGGTSPSQPPVPAGLFLKAALQRIGVISGGLVDPGGGGGGVPSEPGETDLPQMPVVYSNVGEVNPFNVQSDVPFVQAVGVPLGVNVPKGVYGVRVGARQLPVQARTVKHRPNGTANVLRVEGVWPADITTKQTISLTAMPSSPASQVEVQLVSGTLKLMRNGALAHTLTPYAATNPISGYKPNQLKGSNTNPAYINSESFHEWHIPRSGSQSSVGAQYVDITVEEDTAVLRCYLARGRGMSDSDYEFQTRLIVYKQHPWVTWEHTTFKHFPVTKPDSPSNPSTMRALSAERLIVTPASPFTNARLKNLSGNNHLTVQASPYGSITGTADSSFLIGGSLEDTTHNALRLAGSRPLSVSVRDFMGMGPCGFRATPSALNIDFWSEHTSEVLDYRGTGKADEIQWQPQDINAESRGTARTWEGAFLLEDNLPLAQRIAAKDNVWFMTPQALEASEAFGPLRAAAGTKYATWFKRVTGLIRTAEMSAIKNKHFGYMQLGLVPSFINAEVDTGSDAYAKDEPRHSGRYGQSKDSYNASGAVVMNILIGDRKRALRALQGNLMKCDVNGQHSKLYGSQYGTLHGRDGVHRRYRDPYTGDHENLMYYYPESQYVSYWFGGPRRHLERAQRIIENFERRPNTASTHRYPQGPWAMAERYMHTADPADLATLNTWVTRCIERGNVTWPPPSNMTGKLAGVMWDYFRQGHNTVPAVLAVYEATGDSKYLDELAEMYRTQNYSYNSSTGHWRIGMGSYGQHTTPFHGLAYLLLKGYSTSQVSENAVNSMKYWIGDEIEAGTLRNHDRPFPAGEIDSWSWADAMAFKAGRTEPGIFLRRFGIMIASWYAD